MSESLFLPPRRPRSSHPLTALTAQSCHQDRGLFMKNLTMVQPDLAQVMIVDNSPGAYKLQPGMGRMPFPAHSSFLLSHCHHFMLLAILFYFVSLWGGIPIAVTCPWPAQSSSAPPPPPYPNTHVLPCVAENAIPISSWTGAQKDDELLDLLPMLDALQHVGDVRSILSIRT